jgi:hypothetical protein
MNRKGSKRRGKVDPMPQLASCPASRIESAINPTFYWTCIDGGLPAHGCIQRESMLRLSPGMCWQGMEEGREDLEKGTTVD